MAAMEDEEMEKKVQEYLQRKGLRLAEVAVQGDRNHVPTSAPPHLLTR
jgi:transcription initiation factor TFIID subunit 5